ncbi:MAG: hypothetical protein HKN76_09875 [Saprospiraceae bacterium]|nr:hypothetical protein [Saprospiraceae bacterium]
MRLLSLLAIFLPISLIAQDSGRKDFPNLGISFQIPDGWVGQENEAGYVMGSYTDPGIILMTAHQTQNLDQLRVEAQQGLHDNEGTSLSVDGEISKFSSNGLQALYQGSVGFQPAKAFAIGLVNPNGSGVSIIGMSTIDQFSDKHREVVTQIASSVKFSKVTVVESKSEWGNLLQNARLTYMNSYYSSGGSYGGYSTGGGYSDKEIIDLCAQGYFNHSSNSSMAFDTGGGFGSSFDQNAGAGKWKVIVNNQGQDVLQLNFYNGEVYEYVLSLQDNKTYLNDRRFFRTYGNVTDDGPNCN